ncbi:MAG: BlaI/MecI/CopY family transcriptional regulator [Candidatus Eisenbacteria bacterium]|uniref:BlaI/MecI/CopY family transcriptional regulator n=1 Tax=Eiseniibacteriota bacterium TaxID=2212470 RepID=A0A956LXN1_UNCEI|nr:BlaI/MecI/CopY family transcriptional regulator [Candidatus Eisenbacteria bacterium]
MTNLPDLSRFELQCLRKLWELREATVRDVHQALPDAPSYSTVRKIVERLEEKGAVERVRLDGKAWVYRSTVSAPRMIRKEIRRFLDTVFDGMAGPLVSHLAEMDALTVEDLRAAEEQIEPQNGHRSSAPRSAQSPTEGSASSASRAKQTKDERKTRANANGRSEKHDPNRIAPTKKAHSETRLTDQED